MADDTGQAFARQRAIVDQVEAQYRAAAATHAERERQARRSDDEQLLEASGAARDRLRALENMRKAQELAAAAEKTYRALAEGGDDA